MAIARIFGISTIGLNIAFIWTVIILITLITLEIGAIWKFIRIVNGTVRVSADEREYFEYYKFNNLDLFSFKFVIIKI